MIQRILVGLHCDCACDCNHTHLTMLLNCGSSMAYSGCFDRPRIVPQVEWQNLGKIRHSSTFGGPARLLRRTICDRFPLAEAEPPAPRSQMIH